MNAHEVPGGHVFRPDMFRLDLDGIIARLRPASSGAAAEEPADSRQRRGLDESGTGAD